MLTYDVIVVGFGKAGKTLAAKLSSQGKKVALIEKSKSMYGGTCINIACIPTKTLIVAAEKGLDFEQAMSEKNAVTTRLNGKNYATIAGTGVDIIDATARFVSNKVIEIQAGDEKEELTAETIIINTGAVPTVLPIPGLAESKFAVDSTGIQRLENLPKRLGVLGGGPIGLEFAHLYNTLGSQVTVLDAANTFLPRIEPSIAALAKGYLEEDGIQFLQGVHTQEIKDGQNSLTVVTDKGDFEFDILLYATGRKPNTAGLGLENTDIQVTDRGAVQVNRHFETRRNYATTLFIAPPLAQVGLTEQEARDKGLPVAVKELPVAAMPRGHVNADLRGAFKAVVNPETKEILGATLFGEAAGELINLITMAMDNKIPYTYIAKQIFTHPTIAENLNDLFAI